MRSDAAREALKLARELHDTPIEATLPTVDNSLAAIAAAREAATEAEGQDDSVPDDDAGPDDATQSPISVPAGSGAV
jgi:uroporphyrin-3 C-methyltransferase